MAKAIPIDVLRKELNRERKELEHVRHKMMAESREVDQARLQMLEEIEQARRAKRELEHARHTTRTKPEDTTSLSIRLTPQERTLLTTAAEIRGISPTALIKSSAISGAAHVVNTSRKTTFDFNKLARRITRLLFERKRSIEYLVDPRWKGSDDPDDGPCVSYSEWYKSEEYLTERKKFDERAMHLHHAHGEMKFEHGERQEKWLTVETDPETGDPDDEMALRGNAPIVRRRYPAMTDSDYLELRKAVRLGGTEFMHMVLRDALESYFKGQCVDEPVDPSNVDASATE